jgi:hypothetical protein
MIPVPKPAPRSLWQTVSFYGIALSAFGGLAFPYVSKPLQNILIEAYPKQHLYIENGFAIVSGLLVVTGTATGLKGRIDAGGVYTEPHLYGPDKAELEASLAQNAKLELNPAPEQEA